MAETRRPYGQHVGRHALSGLNVSPEMVRFWEQMAADVEAMKAAGGLEAGGLVFDDEAGDEDETSLVIDEEQP
jgi:hypothetical protein